MDFFDESVQEFESIQMKDNFMPHSNSLSHSTQSDSEDKFHKELARLRLQMSRLESINLSLKTTFRKCYDNLENYRKTFEKNHGKTIAEQTENQPKNSSKRKSTKKFLKPE